MDSDSAKFDWSHIDQLNAALDDLRIDSSLRAPKQNRHCLYLRDAGAELAAGSIAISNATELAEGHTDLVVTFVLFAVKRDGNMRIQKNRSSVMILHVKPRSRCWTCLNQMSSFSVRVQHGPARTVSQRWSPLPQNMGCYRFTNCRAERGQY